ncbi:MAG: protein TolR [Magnetococcales bacterium]|nr:protein TolR [Magnetococcales bacterium]
MGMSMQMGNGGGSDRHAMSEINVTPLVDIMLVLLIIFMVTAPLLNQGVEVNLPNASADPLRSDTEPLVVTVLADGRIAIEDKIISAASLDDKITAIRKNAPELTVYVRGDETTPYGDVMRVMAQLQQSGVHQVGLVTDPES